MPQNVPPPSGTSLAARPSVEMGALRSAIATVGAWTIFGLIRVLGRKVELEEVPWLDGPLGGASIGDAPYDEFAADHGLTVVRDSDEGGLIVDFERLRGRACDVDAVAPAIRAFYERTAGYRMDVWTRSWFPMNLGLWLLVTTISRKVDQLNFPIDALDTARGMSSEIILLRDDDGSVRYTGWFRKLASTRRVLYTGFYMLTGVPAHDSPCVKVVFPMPAGNATVILRPESGPDGEFRLVSSGREFGDVGFYRIHRFRDGLWVWRIRTLRERFRVFVDEDDTLRCDHTVHFLGLPVLTLHYRIEPRDR